MNQTSQRSRGRPLKGKKRRRVASFTLSPDAIETILRLSRAQRKSKSEMLEEVIDRTGETWSSLAEVRLPVVALRRFCKEHNIKRLRLFGSALSGKLRPDSDIDLLVEFQEGQVPGLFQIENLREQLNPMFEGREIDLRTPQDLSKYFRDSVEREALTLYGEE